MELTLPAHLELRFQHSRDYGFRYNVLNTETDSIAFYGDWHKPGAGQMARAEESTLYWWARQ